ncbi:MAG: DUF4215 domain-containing protein [Myxococcota bacterium]|nr:DUF4215 domain-containing protein [Myxococcota bacterium]
MTIKNRIQILVLNMMFLGCSDSNTPASVDQFRPLVDSTLSTDLAIDYDLIDGAPDDSEDATLPFQDMFMGDCRSNAECDDGLFCNGQEICSNYRCYAAPSRPCDDGIRCTADSCSDETRECRNEPSPDRCPENHLCDLKLGCFPIVPCERDDDCIDGTECNGEESCFEGRCTPGQPIVCDDDVECTIDVCVDRDGSCEFLPVHGRCIETQLCAVAEGCVDRPECQTNDDCDDNSFCNGVETCNQNTGQCQPGEAPEIDDGVPCTIDVCSDVFAMVLHTPAPARCSDGQFCNGAEVCHPIDGCQAGTPPALSDGIACTQDVCNEQLDIIEHRTIDAACDDDLFCNGEERCHPQSGCQPGEPPQLDDNVGCTIDRCSEVERRVIHVSEDSLCDDNLFCNGAERCLADQGCIAGVAPPVDDGIPCTIDSCDENTDQIIHRVDSTVCDDGLFCNGAERCIANEGCAVGAVPILDDGVACTVDRCDEETDQIIHQADASRCDDGLFCNGIEVCDLRFGCQAGVPPDVDDSVDCTIDTCDEVSDQLSHIPSNDVCNDGLFCNGVEFCDLRLGCREGIPPSTNDDVDCTIDSCDEERDMIVNRPDHTVCSNNSFCDGTEQCAPEIGCLPGLGRADGTLCEVEPRSLCIAQNCRPTACGDGFTDVAGGEECDDGNLNDADGCSSACQTEGAGGNLDHAGLFTIDPVVRFSCGLFGIPLVDVHISRMGFVVGGGRLEVSASPGPKPPTMIANPAPEDRNFSVVGVHEGGCNEIYRLSGAFEPGDNSVWRGRLVIEFEGPDCAFTTCNGQRTFQVRGQRLQ